MDIIQLSYLVSIVKCNFNLSEASKQIHVTQSALSQFIANFEEREGFSLFVRRNNRLIGLTKSGEVIYHHAQEIVNRYEEMMFKARQVVKKEKSTVKIGVPSLILMVYFSSLFPKIMANLPSVNVEVIDAGSQKVRNLLLANEIDIAVILEPTQLNPFTYQQELVHTSEFSAFINHNHPLSKKNTLDWKDILNYDVATFNEEFTTHQLIGQRLNELKYNKGILYTANAWDYLMNLTMDSDVVTFLPDLIYRYCRQDVIERCQMIDPVQFTIYACRAKKDNYSVEEEYVFKQIVTNFESFKMKS